MVTNNQVRLGQCRTVSAVNSCVKRRPESKMSTTAARHYFITSSVKLKIRNLLPCANWSPSSALIACTDRLPFPVKPRSLPVVYDMPLPLSNICRRRWPNWRGQ